MGRIRTIKPEFFKHEEIYEAEAKYKLPLRVAFIGLWCCADRMGRFKWKPNVLKLDVLPYDKCDFEKVLNALCDEGFISQYEHEGKYYGVILSFLDHQVINNRESDSSLPVPSNFFTRAHASRTCTRGREGKGKGRE